MRYLITFIAAVIFLPSCKKDKKKEDVIVQETDAPPSPPKRDRERPPSVAGFVDFNDIETSILNDLADLNLADQQNSRYLILSDKFNENPDSMGTYLGAIDKAVNSLSSEREISDVSAIDDDATVFRIDLRDYNITSTDWRLIEDNDPFKFQSFTEKGQIISALTNARRPWMHGNNFIFTAHNNNVYYDVLEIPETLVEFYKFVGVNAQEEFDAFDGDLFLAGFFGSPIAIQKNRLLQRLDARDGPLWSTYDTVLGSVDNRKNLFEDPFPLEARNNKVFNHDAQEFIATLPNGLLMFALFDALGKRANFAPTDTVIDVNANGLDPTIRNSLSCFRCHNNGVISANDQIRNHVLNNPDFNIAEQQLAQAYFRPNEALQAIFKKDQAGFAANIIKLGIDPESPDPVNELVDELRREMDLKQIASFFFMRENDFRSALEGSLQVKGQIGQLLNGDTISLDQLITTAPDIIADFNLFRDNINE